MKLGLIGGGQLAQMLGAEARSLGWRAEFLDPSPTACARLTSSQQTAAFDSVGDLKNLFNDNDKVSFEFENVDLESLKQFDQKKLFPPLKSLEVSQDRLVEKEFLNSHGIATAEFYPVDSLKDLESALQKTEHSGILKTRRLGYDGKGQQRITPSTPIEDLWSNSSKSQLILEQMIDFDYELSLVAGRNSKGETCFFPLTRNNHIEGILAFNRTCPELYGSSIEKQAESVITKLLDALSYVGVLTIEFFVLGDKLIVNEIAPRVHNSGHWSYQSGFMSQFECHLRCGDALPICDVKPRNIFGIVNIVGAYPSVAKALKVKSARFFSYQKEERVGRKIGHIQLRADSADEFKARLEPLLEICGWPSSDSLTLFSEQK